MSEEDIQPTRYGGRTYGRSKQSASSKAFDVAEGRNVQVKAAMSVTKWGQSNYIPLRGSDEGAPENKKMKIESTSEDPFSFDIEDVRKKAPVKREIIVSSPDASRNYTRLPASRIILEADPADKEPKKAPIRTYQRKTPKKPVILDQFVEVGKNIVHPSGEQTFLPVVPKVELKKEEDDDDIFPVQFKRDPLKTYSGEVVTPVERPESPPSKNNRYKRKGGPRGRRPLTVTDPDLIEEYKRNYAAQQMRDKPDTSTGGLNNSMVVSKQELANEDQGTTVVVVCKPKAHHEKGEVQARYFSKNTKGVQGLVVPVALHSAGPQTDMKSEIINSEANGNTEQVNQWPLDSDLNSPAISTGSEETFNTPGSNVSAASSISPQKRVTRTRASHVEMGSAQSGAASITPSDSSQGDSSSKSGKRYRIFKSRTSKTPVEDSKEEDENPLPSEFQAPPEEHFHQVIPENSENTELEPFGGMSFDRVEVQIQPSLTPEETEEDPSYFDHEDSSHLDNSEAMEGIFEDDNVNSIDPTAARASLAARLRNVDSDEQDNVSEFSEIFGSQESPVNSQSTVEENSQKEATNNNSVRKFFKSKKSSSSGSDLQRKLLKGSPTKSPVKATYNARSWNNDPERDGEKEEPVLRVSKRKTVPDFDDEEIVLVKDANRSSLKREVHWPERKHDMAYTSLRVSQTHKKLYTVVHNVKQTHEVQELGETQDFIDDVDYLLDSLQDTKSTSIRCLSCLKLAGKCIMPGFRMHIRAHGTVTKIFSLLHDACSDPSLALSTSAMMFMLSRDRLNMDLDQDSLNLMLRLNEVDASDKSSFNSASMKELEKTKQRVTELLAQLQMETAAREIDLGFISTGNLAMESLLSLTSRRAGEWFKEELRSNGGLDHIVDSVSKCEKSLPDQMPNDNSNVLSVLRKLDRCLRVLENISLQNEDNQKYLIAYKKATLLRSCSRTLRFCQRHMGEYKLLGNLEDPGVKDLPGYTIFTCMMAVLKVLLNITHERKLGNFKGQEEIALMETIATCLTATQWCIPVDQRFDISILCLGLLINLVENEVTNRKKFFEMTTQVKLIETSQPKTTTLVKAVVQIFVQREESARQMEEDSETTPDNSMAESPNKSGEWQESDSGIQWITNSLKKVKQVHETSKVEEPKEEEANQSILEDDEETFMKALHKAGKHMENSIVAAYAGLLLGTAVLDSKAQASNLKELIPNGDFGPMIKILKKFLNFMSLTTAFGSTDVNGITRVIDVLEGT